MANRNRYRRDVHGRGRPRRGERPGGNREGVDDPARFRGRRHRRRPRRDGDYGIAPEAVSLLSHATTIVTNALLESKGADVALVATWGFRDVLEIRRSARAGLYDLFQDTPAVLVPRRRRLEVTERIGEPD